MTCIARSDNIFKHAFPSTLPKLKYHVIMLFLQKSKHRKWKMLKFLFQNTFFLKKKGVRKSFFFNLFLDGEEKPLVELRI